MKPNIFLSEKSIVYYTRKINSRSLVDIYNKLEMTSLPGKTAVKISSGEPGGHNFLSPNLIKDLVQGVDGTIVECNTAYKGHRDHTMSHLRVLKDHGFTDIAKCDIMDAQGSMILHPKGKYLKENFVGLNLSNYSFLIDLAHVTGHILGGMGACIKNVAIGCCSKMGKCWVHSAGRNLDQVDMNLPADIFQECMVESAKSIVDYFKWNMAFIAVLNNISIDCDCSDNPAEPVIPDLGIMASKDPLAIDKAAYDMIIESPHAESFIRRFHSRKGHRLFEYGKEFGLGNINYELVFID